jgi:hypothetical protein
MNSSPIRDHVYTVLFSNFADHLTLYAEEEGRACGTISKVGRYRQRKKAG